MLKLGLSRSGYKAKWRGVQLGFGISMHFKKLSKC
jgi:hypothetical protein